MEDLKTAFNEQKTALFNDIDSMVLKFKEQRTALFDDIDSMVLKFKESISSKVEAFNMLAGGGLAYESSVCLVQDLTIDAGNPIKLSAELSSSNMYPGRYKSFYIVRKVLPTEDEVRNKATLNMKIDDCEIAVRTYNCLRYINIETIGQLIQLTESELLKTKNFGRKSLKEVKELLAPYGLKLGMKV